MDTFARGALTFDVLDGGPADGELVLLLHGFPQSARSWDQVAPRLQDAGYRTLAPNQRGYSPGARPEGRRAYAIDELVEDAVAAIDAAGATTAHVVGHDWGAAVAWGLAAAHPERVASLTALSVPHTSAFLRALVRGPQLPHSWYMLAFQLPVLPERYISPQSAAGRARFVKLLTGSGLPAGAAQRDADVLAEPGALKAAVNWYRAVPFSDPRGATGRKVTVPTTYVWSDRDSFVTRTAATGCGRYVEAPYRFEILRGVDHWIPENAAETVAPLILDQIRAV
jgi:pimeloyl-ACP methyl ester carboxylesterase